MYYILAMGDHKKEFHRQAGGPVGDESAVDEVAVVVVFFLLMVCDNC